MGMGVVGRGSGARTRSTLGRGRGRGRERGMDMGTLGKVLGREDEWDRDRDRGERGMGGGMRISGTGMRVRVGVRVGVGRPIRTRGRFPRPGLFGRLCLLLPFSLIRPRPRHPSAQVPPSWSHLRPRPRLHLQAGIRGGGPSLRPARYPRLRFPSLRLDSPRARGRDRGRDRDT